MPHLNIGLWTIYFVDEDLVEWVKVQSLSAGEYVPNVRATRSSTVGSDSSFTIKKPGKLFI